MTSTSVYGKPVKGPNAPVPEEPAEEEEAEFRASVHMLEPVPTKRKGKGTSRTQTGQDKNKASIPSEDEHLHGNYMELMDYLQKYKESICYEATGMLPNTNINDREDEREFKKEDDMLTAGEIWPVIQSGPKKGQVKPTLDSRGKIVVDPAGNILREQYLLDFNVYRNLHF